MVVEIEEEFSLGEQFLFPFFLVEGHGFVEVFFGVVFEIIGIEVFEVRGPADLSFVGGDAAVAALADPF